MPADPKLMDALLGIVHGDQGDMMASDEESMLQDALRRSRALLDKDPQQHSSALGGLFGAIGQVGNSVAGNMQQQKAQKQMAELYRQKAEAMRTGGPSMLDEDLGLGSQGFNPMGF
jgi:hypothetical protein